MSWNFAEAIDHIGQGPLSQRPALIHEQTVINFAELRSRSRGIAAWLQSLGLTGSGHIGHYLRNSNAYLENFFGASLAGYTHVNVNYRYQSQELQDLCNSLDVEVLVYSAEFADRVAAIKPHLSKTVAFVEVTEEALKNDFAISMAELYQFSVDDLQTNTSDENHIVIATGGTTGLPKGTQWQHTGLWHKMKVWGFGAMAALGLQQPPASMDEYIGLVETLPASPAMFPLCPLMHGTGLMMAIAVLAQGGPVVTSDNAKFDAKHCLDLIQQYKVGSLVIVGDAFAVPLLTAIEERQDGCFDSIMAVISSGAILSDENRNKIKALGNIMLMDTLGSSEASGYALTTEQAGVFLPMPTTKVFDDELNEVQPGSDTIGIAYAGGYIPVGYYNEPEKTAETFVVIDGMRYVKTGDRCTVRSDGMLELLGRDSTVINTGGEKVYTVEVEQLLLKHELISDAVLVGLPHPRFGKMVTAVVEGDGLTNSNIDVPALQEYLRAQLADYKVPRKIYAIDSMERFANGKIDYKMLTDYAQGCFDNE